MTQENISFPGSPFKPSHVLRRPLAYTFLQKRGTCFFTSHSWTTFWWHLTKPHLLICTVLYKYENRILNFLCVSRWPIPTIAHSMPALHHPIYCTSSHSDMWCFIGLLPVAVTTCLRQQWHLHTICLVPTIWNMHWSSVEKNRIPLWSCNSDI